MSTTVVPVPTLKVTEVINASGVGIRRFDDEHIQAAIDRALAGLPADKKIAAVAHADLNGISLSIVTRLGADWSVAAACYKPYSGKLSAEAEVRWSPF
jgi:hypothetical protein